MIFLKIDFFALYFISMIVILSVGLISIPSVLGYFFYKWLKKKNRTLEIFGLLLLLGIIIYTLFSSYFAFYPRDKFFKREFSLNTGIDFPTNARVLLKHAPYPNLQGGYNSSAIIKLDSIQFQKIKKTLLESNSFKHFDPIKRVEEFYEFPDTVKFELLDSFYKSEFDFDNENFSIYFSSDYEHIGFRYRRW